MKSHKIAVISDTHGVLRDDVKDCIKDCEYILHAGDVGSPEVLAELEKMGTLYAVRGNVDGKWAENLPQDLTLELLGFKFYLIHDKKKIITDLSGFDFVVCGHSHKYEIIKTDTVTYLNSGSCGRKRFSLPLTLMLLTLFPDEHKFITEKIELKTTPKNSVNEKEINKLIEKTIKEIRMGKTEEETAKRLKADKELISQIYRIYFTHKDISTDEILKRMEIWGL